MANSGRISDELFRTAIGLIDNVSVDAAFAALRNGTALIRFRPPRDQFILDEDGNGFATREVASQAVERCTAAHSVLSGIVLEREDLDGPRDEIVRKKLRKLGVIIISRLAFIKRSINPYVPAGVDERKRVKRDVVTRPGQGAFKISLVDRYGCRCPVTGATTPEVLEAAHICPYLGSNDDHPENGILLRADIHALFDSDLLRIEPESSKIEIASTVTDESDTSLHGLRLNFASGKRPSVLALRLKYGATKR